LAAVADRIVYSSATVEATTGNTPKHIAIVMDGNGRWAKQNGLPRIAGHRRGVDAVRATVSACRAHTIPYLTLFAFSSENWKRPANEVRLLMELFSSTLEKELRLLNKNDVCLRVIGDLDGVSENIRRRIKDAEKTTAENKQVNLTIALNYGGQWDITQACRKLSQDAVTKKMSGADICSLSFEQYLTTKVLPAPDLFIRTGGDQRLSNFLLWQLAYTELYFTQTLWPAFNKQALDEALKVYAQRQRRYGLTDDQIQKQSHV